MIRTASKVLGIHEKGLACLEFSFPYLGIVLLAKIVYDVTCRYTFVVLNPYADFTDATPISL